MIGLCYGEKRLARSINIIELFSLKNASHKIRSQKQPLCISFEGGRKYLQKITDMRRKNNFYQG